MLPPTTSGVSVQDSSAVTFSRTLNCRWHHASQYRHAMICHIPHIVQVQAVDSHAGNGAVTGIDGEQITPGTIGHLVSVARYVRVIFTVIVSC